MRVFLAIDIPWPLKERAARLQARLKKADGAVRWVDPKFFHLTVFFLGNLEEEDVRKVGEAVAAALSGFPSFHLALGSAALFSSPKRPRVVLLSVKGDVAAFLRLRQRARTALREALPNLKERFLGEKEPHLTLGRVTSGGYSLPKVAPRIKAEFGVESLTLYQSQLSPQGSVYTPLREIKLHLRPRYLQILRPD